MKTSSFFCLIFVLVSLFSLVQSRQVLSVDQWAVDQVIFQSFNNASQLPLTFSQAASDSTAFGGQRMLVLTLLGGFVGRPGTLACGSGVFTSAAATSGDQLAYVLWTGTKNSTTPVTNILNIDLTNNGGVGFQFNASSDHNTTYTFSVFGVGDTYDTASNFTFFVEASADTVITTYDILFSDFSNYSNNKFQHVAAMQFTANGGFNVDTFAQGIFVFGPSISGTVFKDCNQDQIQDNGEVGLVNVTVNLFLNTSNVIYTSTKTDVNGNFLLGAIPGLYTLCINTPANGVETNSPLPCYSIDVIGASDYPGNNFGVFFPLTITIPPTATINCNQTATTSLTGTATSSGCTPSTVNFSDTTTPSGICSAIYTINRLWVATDQNANTNSGTQTINVVDHFNPAFQNFPNNSSVNCTLGSTLPINTGGSPSATHPCVTPTVTFADAAPSGTCNTPFLRTWTATDGCGNSISRVQQITITDTVTPSFSSFPQNHTYTCGTSIVPPLITDVPTGTAPCGTIVNVTYSDTNVTSSCTTTVNRKWTIIDNCGNTNSRIQVITLTNNVPLTYSYFPADVNVTCNVNTKNTSNTNGQPIASNPCGSRITYSFNDSSVINSCSSGIQRTWHAIDNCGNSAPVQVQQIFVIANQIPVFVDFPKNYTGSCSKGSNSNVTGAPNGSDGCGLDFFITNDDVFVNSSACNTVIDRVWTIQDSCGNQQSQTQLVTIVDDVFPAFINFPANQTLECVNSTSTTANGVPGVTDACFTGIVPTSQDITNVTTPCITIINRIWTATDPCGNAVSKSQYLTLTNKIPPTFTNFPANLTLDCSAGTFPNTTGTPGATDLCDPNPQISYNDVKSGALCPGGLLISRTWTATDNCGNKASQVQQIIVTVTSPPTITIPHNITIGCAQTPSTTITGTAVGASACDATLTTNYTDSPKSNGNCPFFIVRTWSTYDGCGNKASGQQYIYFQDITPPTIHVPAAVTINCTQNPDNLNITGYATATDNCDNTPVIEYDDTVVDAAPGPGVCPGNKIITRTFTAADNCGNVASGTQIITVKQITASTCRPVACAPVPCDQSACPNNTISQPSDSCSCCSAPAQNCQPAPCTSSQCLPRNCEPQPCICNNNGNGNGNGNGYYGNGNVTVVNNTIISVCIPPPCNHVQIIYIDDISQITNTTSAARSVESSSEGSPVQRFLFALGDDVQVQQKPKSDATTLFTLSIFAFLALIALINFY